MQEFDTPLTGQKYITNQMLDQQDAHLVQDYIRPIVELDPRPFGQRFLLKQKFQIRVEAEVANRAVGAVPIDPNVRVSEPVEPAAAAAAGGQPAAMKVKNRSSC